MRKFLFILALTGALAGIAVPATAKHSGAKADPAKPTGDGPRGDRGAMASELATALGVTTAQVQTILDANRPVRPAAGTPGTRPPRGARPSNTKLIAALAGGLNLDEATVQAAFDKIDAAHQAEHAARDAAMYTALAGKLGVSADAVKAAFEANRPAKRAA